MGNDVRVERGVRRDREYFRVSTLLPLRHTAAKREELEAFVESLELRPWRAETESDVSPEARLERIERKLDRILSILDPAVPRPLDEADLRVLELSGSGVRYPWPAPEEPGTELLLRFRLLGVGSREVRCVGVVRSCDEPAAPGDPYMLAVSFSHISEDDRDAIVRHTLDVERRTLRPGDANDRT